MVQIKNISLIVHINDLYNKSLQNNENINKKNHVNLPFFVKVLVIDR